MSDTESIELLPRTSEIGLAMLFPDEHRWRKARQSAIARRFLQYIRDTNCTEIVIKDSRVIEYLCEAPSFQELRRSISTGYDHGALSGALLHFVLAANSYEDTKTYATISAAARYYSRINKGICGLGEANIKLNIWPQYRSVASLWAALQLFPDWHENAENFPVRESQIELFLYYAMRIQLLGGICRPPHSSSSLLEPSQRWIRGVFGNGSILLISKEPQLKYGRLSDQMIRLAAVD